MQGTVDNVSPPPVRPSPPPLHVRELPVIWAGTGAWCVALVAAVVFRERLASDGTGWWLWTCVAGVALGAYAVRHFRRRENRAAASTSGTGPSSVTDPSTSERRSR